jgi:hypothetical protein
VIKGSVYRERTNWFEGQLFTDGKELKPRYPAPGVLAARAEIPAAIELIVYPQIPPTRHE